MSDFPEEKWSTRRERRSPSLFGPIVLIAVGVYFLLYNLGYVPTLNWIAALQLWPILLIFIGVNLIVHQAPRPWGTILSALVAITAVGFFGYVLLFGNDAPFLRQLDLTANAEFQTQEIAASAVGVETADVTIDFAAPPANVFPLEDSNDLIAGTVTYLDDVNFETDSSGGVATVRLETRDSSGWFWLDPRNWNDFGTAEPWQIGLSLRVPLDLRFDVGSGAVNLNLSTLQLDALRLDGGSGATVISLPGGDYGAVYNAGSGATQMALPPNGRQTVEIEGGSGSMTLALPRTMQARVEVNDGSGSFSLPRDRFTQIEGNQPDDGVWVTEDYDNAADAVLLILDVGSGSVRIVEE